MEALMFEVPKIVMTAEAEVIKAADIEAAQAEEVEAKA
jgi:outer membrane cobalamin receptor